jgi:hypothetical protein
MEQARQCPTHPPTKRLSSFEVGACSDQMPIGRLLFYLPHVASDQVERDQVEAPAKMFGGFS